jgi:hypothetical protein
MSRRCPDKHLRRSCLASVARGVLGVAVQILVGELFHRSAV